MRLVESARSCMLLAALAGWSAFGQQPPVPAPAANASAVDASLEVAQELVGEALFLRGFYAGNELAFDAAGKVEGTPKTTDWTLAGMDVQKAMRKGPGRIELQGVRVAIRYNQDQHLFERHPQKDDKMQVTIADAGDAKALKAALHAIFAQGIDPEMQASMPEYWRHYFNPALAWPKDELTGKAVFGSGGAAPPAGFVETSPEKRVEPKFTNFAQRDHVKGTAQVRLVVDETGTPRRVAVLLPLGYGLDERVVQAVEQWRFRPATRQGMPVPAGVVVNQAFDYLTRTQ